MKFLKQCNKNDKYNQENRNPQSIIKVTAPIIYTSIPSLSKAVAEETALIKQFNYTPKTNYQQHNYLRTTITAPAAATVTTRARLTTAQLLSLITDSNYSLSAVGTVFNKIILHSLTGNSNKSHFTTIVVGF